MGDGTFAESIVKVSDWLHFYLIFNPKVIQIRLIPILHDQAGVCVCQIKKKLSVLGFQQEGHRAHAVHTSEDSLSIIPQPGSRRLNQLAFRKAADPGLQHLPGYLAHPYQTLFVEMFAFTFLYCFALPVNFAVINIFRQSFVQKKIRALLQSQK